MFLCAFVFVHCCLVVTCWERADLLALVGDDYCIFCNFPMGYPWSGVVLDFIVSRSLPSLILASVDSEEPVLCPFKLRHSNRCSVGSLRVIENSSD